MAVTAPVSLSKIRAEFGGASPPANLKAYYRGGPYVPDTPTNAAIATDPNLLAITQFLNAAASVPPAVAMPNTYCYGEGQSGFVTSPFDLYSNGTWQGTYVSGTWLTAGSPGDVEVYATYSGGAGASWGGTFNTWLNLANGAGWSLGRTTNGSSNGFLNLTFRNKNTLAQLDTASVSIEVYRGIPV